MSCSLRYAPQALRDMDEVWNGVYEASKSFDLADQYVNEFAAAIAEKKHFPHSGIPLVYRGLFTGFYCVHFKKYIAFYRVNEGYIEVIRIIMEKRDYLTILFGKADE